MKNLTALLVAIFCATLHVSAQSSLTSVKYDKTEQPALMLELPYDEEVSEGFIVSSLKKTGYNPETKGSLFWKNNKINGFYIFKGVRLEGLKESVDLYFKVDQKSRRHKDESVIYMMVSKGAESFVSSGTDEKVYDAAKSFLNGFVSQAAAYKLDLDIQAQQESVTDAQKKLSKMKDQEKSLSKKIENLRDDLKKNKEDQDEQEKTLEKERRKLAELKEKAE